MITKVGVVKYGRLKPGWAQPSCGWWCAPIGLWRMEIWRQLNTKWNLYFERSDPDLSQGCPYQSMTKRYLCGSVRWWLIHTVRCSPLPLSTEVKFATDALLVRIQTKMELFLYARMPWGACNVLRMVGGQGSNGCGETCGVGWTPEIPKADFNINQLKGCFITFKFVVELHKECAW